jgi:hypothetical protein
LFVVGCTTIDDVFRGSTIAPIEIWNRTNVPIFLIDEAGTRIDVPACDHTEPVPLDLDHVQVRTEEGYIYGFGTRPNGAHQYLVFVALSGESELTTILPVEIPPCEGEPNVQPGV